MAGPTAVVLARVPGAGALLSAREQARMAAFRRPEDGLDYLAAHALVRLCAARLAGVAAEVLRLSQRCPHCGAEDHGAPYLEGRPQLSVSLSHTRGYVAAVAGPGVVGVDVEHGAAQPADEGVAELALAPAERATVAADPHPGVAFAKVWVRKEALVKAGRLTLDGLAGTDLSDAGRHWDGLRLLDWSAAGVQGAAATAAPAALDLLEQQ